VSRDGRIRKEGNEYIIEVVDSAGSLDFGAECINKQAPPEERIYQKVFKNKRIFLPNEYNKAMELLKNDAGFIFSLNGYSSLKLEWLNKYGITPGAYEDTCTEISYTIIDRLRQTMPKSRLFMIDGASDMGIDKVIADVAFEQNITRLSFSCPEYMLYVVDDHNPVFVANTKAEYANYYIKSLDLLISTGGRKQALEHDVSAACIYQKRIHFADVMNILSNGRVPATIVGEDGEIVIENAAAAFGSNISYFSYNDAVTVSNTSNSGDRFEALFENIAKVATDVCRRRMPPGKMFRH